MTEITGSSITGEGARLMLVADIMDVSWPACRLTEDVPGLFTIFERHDLCVVPVLDEEGLLVGLVPADGFLRRYHLELRVQTS